MSKNTLKLRMSRHDTSSTLMLWEQKVHQAQKDCNPFSKSYVVLDCKVDGCDSHQLNDFCLKQQTLNCEYVDVSERLCNKHMPKL